MQPNAEQRLDAAEAAQINAHMAQERDAAKAEQARQDSIASIQNSINRADSIGRRNISILEVLHGTITKLGH